MKTCSACGSTMKPLARFCGDCGAPAQADESDTSILAAATANAEAAGRADLQSPVPSVRDSANGQSQPPMKTETLSAFCTNCGATLPPGARFCGACGTQSLTAIPAIPSPEPAATAAARAWQSPPREPVPPYAMPPRPPEPAPPTTFVGAAAVPVVEKPSSKGRWIAAAAALVVLLIAASVAAYIIGGRDSHKSAEGQNSSTTTPPSSTSTTGTGTTTTTITPAAFEKQMITVVRSDQGALSGMLAHVSVNGSTPSALVGANAAAERLRTDLKAQQAKLGQAPDGIDQLPLLSRALTAHRGYAAAVVALTASPAAFTQATAQQVQHDALVAARLYGQLGHGTITFAQEAHLVALTSTLAQNKAEQAQRDAANAVLRGYLNRIDAILSYSAQGRKDLGTITANIRNNSLDPSSGSDELQGVVNNRQSVLGQIESMQSSISGDPNVPAQIAPLLSQLHSAMSNSEQADEAYQSWAANLPYDYDFQYYNQTYNDAFAHAGTYDAAASSAKRAFVSQYDPLARQVGLGTWSDTGF